MGAEQGWDPRWWGQVGGDTWVGELHAFVRLVRRPRREQDGFFVRAESLYNVASEIEALDRADPTHPLLPAYGGRSRHEQAHGESFLALATHRFRGRGRSLRDEPQDALCPTRPLARLTLLDEHVRRRGSPVLLATPSPILLAYPGAVLYRLTQAGIAPVAYEEPEHFQVTHDVLVHRETSLHQLLATATKRQGRASCHQRDEQCPE